MIMKPLASNLVLHASATVDLQMHTTYSDGTWTPEELIDYLVGEQFGLVAVTDHDRVDSVANVQRLGAQRQLPILAAVEMSTSWKGGFTDLLCYGFDPERNELHELAQAVVLRQQEITQEVYEELQRNGYAFSRQHEVLKEERGEPLQPRDLELLLQHHGYSTGPGSIGQIMTDAGFYFATNDIGVVVDAAHRSGAVCLIAHPGRGGDFTLYEVDLLDELRNEAPIDGLEAHYPAHTPEQTAMYLNYAQEHNLLTSSGSDSHGPEKKPIKYRAELSRQLLERVGIRVE
ncbi:MAG TPA: PHP domain-containing protein [Chloroflexia bacterium]|nr:PHP domain-containing protein [Chloroflexia bacterium]